MTREKALKVVQDILIDMDIHPEDYKLTDSYESIGFDSLDIVEFGMDVEEILNMDYEFTNAQYNKIHTIEDIVKLVESV